MTVEYRDIAGQPGYRVGNDGSVWTCKMKAAGVRGFALSAEWKALVPIKHSAGYRIVTLWTNNKPRQVGVHILVLEAFFGGRPVGAICIHRDDDKTNNSVLNIFWGKHSDRNQKGPRNNLWRGGRTINTHGYVRVYAPGHHRAVKGTVLEHVLIAERALGKSLPNGAQVHHVNGERADNRNSNLVICPNSAYHALIHRRTRAIDACGHPHWRPCIHCKKHDDPKNMYVSKSVAHHRDCHAAYEVARKKEVRRKEAAA